MCSLQFKQVTDLNTLEKVILILHYNDVELVITDSSIIKECRINSKESKTIHKTHHGKFVTGALHNSIFVCITSKNYCYVIDLEKRKVKKQFYLDDGPPTKKCCLIGDNLVYATEDDCLVHVNITNHHCSSSYHMNSHIVHICSYNDRFLVIDQSGTFYFYRCDRGFHNVDRHYTNCPCFFGFVPRQDCYSDEPDYTDCLLYNNETNSIVRYQLPEYTLIDSYGSFDETSSFLGMCLYGDVLCFLFRHFLHIYRLDDNSYVTSVYISPSYSINTISSTSQFIVLGSELGNVYYCILDEDKANGTILRSSLRMDRPVDESMYSDYNGVVDDGFGSTVNGNIGSTANGNVGSNIGSNVDSSTHNVYTSSINFKTSEDLKQLLQESKAYHRVKPELSKESKDWEEYLLCNKMIFYMSNEPLPPRESVSINNNSNNDGFSGYVRHGTGAINGVAIDGDQIGKNSQPSEPFSPSSRPPSRGQFKPSPSSPSGTSEPFSPSSGLPSRDKPIHSPSPGSSSIPPHPSSGLPSRGKSFPSPSPGSSSIPPHPSSGLPSRGKSLPIPIIVVSIPPRPSSGLPSRGKTVPTPSSPLPLPINTNLINQSPKINPEPSNGLSPSRSPTEGEKKVKKKGPVLKPRRIISSKEKKKYSFNALPPNGRKQRHKGIVLEVMKNTERMSSNSNSSSHVIPRIVRMQEPQGVTIRHFRTSEGTSLYSFDNPPSERQWNDTQEPSMNDNRFVSFMNQRISAVHRV